MDAVQVYENTAVQRGGGINGAMSAIDIKAQVNLIQEVMSSVMLPDVHYGKIPGTGDKPSLLKAGAEKLCMVFRLGPDYEVVDKERDGDHLTITSKCTLTHIPTGQKIGSALGSCSTMESKYAYRKGARKCPHCNVEAIIKGKAEYGGGWLCFKNKGGCGAKWNDGAQEIESQETGKIANEDKADQYNTVLKMSNKRALLAAVLNATAASDIFNQDLADDLSDGTVETTPAGVDAAARAAAKPRKAAEPKAKAAPKQGEVPAGPTAPGAINATQLRILRKKLVTPENEAAFCTAFGVETVESLPAAKINEALAWSPSPAGQE